jgi:hypothetical protein
MEKKKELRAVRKDDGWVIKLGSDVLYVAFVDRAKRVLHVSPVPDTLEALESGRRYQKNLMSGEWRGTDPDGRGGKIADVALIARLDAIRILCPPFPTVGSLVVFSHPNSNDPTPGVVLEVSRNKQKVWKAWVETAEGTRYCIPKAALTRPGSGQKQEQAASAGGL